MALAAQTGTVPLGTVPIFGIARPLEGAVPKGTVPDLNL
jgi:hypothetical protein